MKNKALIFVLIFAVIFGLLAALSVSRFLKQTQSAGVNSIVVAKVEIPVGSRILEEQLMMVTTPRNATPEESFSSIDKVVGRITLTRIAANEPITQLRLAREGVAAGLSAIIPEGYRAMTVKVDDEAGISGFLVPGTIVDVLAVIKPPDKDNSDPISKIVLQNIKVLANGENLDEPKDRAEPSKVTTVTLQVTPEQAEKLVLSSYDGKLRLALRNSIDQGDRQTSGATKLSLLTGESAGAIPAAGATKDQQPEAPARRQVRRKKSAQVMSAVGPNAAAAQPARPKSSIDVFEGVKKRTVEFPN